MGISLSGNKLIYIDQRGVGFSLPSLYCPEVALDKAIVASMSYTESIAAETERVQQCAARLQAEGVNLAAYNVEERAADINDLRRLWGYQQ
jgi:pimeloyl-ACP methyl ester carboxylesterase